MNTWDKPYVNGEFKETAEAFEIFIIYRDMKERSLKKLEKVTKIKYYKLAYWSKTYKWNMRIKQMLEYNASEISKEKLSIEKEAITSIKERISLKNELIKKLFLLFEKELNKKKDRKDLKELILMYRSLESIENTNIDNLGNINELDNISDDADVNIAELRAVISDVNDVLAGYNNTAIDEYATELKDDEY